jgi:hypothetical protein
MVWMGDEEGEFSAMGSEVECGVMAGGVDFFLFVSI